MLETATSRDKIKLRGCKISSFYVVHFLGSYHRATVWSASRLDVWYEQATVTSPSWDTNYLCRYSKAFCKEIRFSTEKIDRCICKRREKEWFCILRERILLGRWKRVELPLSVVQSRTKSYGKSVICSRYFYIPRSEAVCALTLSVQRQCYKRGLPTPWLYFFYLSCHVIKYQIDFLTSCQTVRLYRIRFICSEFHEIMRLESIKYSRDASYPRISSILELAWEVNKNAQHHLESSSCFTPTHVSVTCKGFNPWSMSIWSEELLLPSS